MRWGTRSKSLISDKIRIHDTCCVMDVPLTACWTCQTWVGPADPSRSTSDTLSPSTRPSYSTIQRISVADPGCLSRIQIFSIPDPGSRIFSIPDPGFRIFYIPDPGSASENLSILTQKKRFLSSRKYDPGCISRIRIQIFYPSRLPDPGVKKRHRIPDPDPQHCRGYSNTYHMYFTRGEGAIN
jgi:hypothetical protein